MHRDALPARPAISARWGIVLGSALILLVAGAWWFTRSSPRHPDPDARVAESNTRAHLAARADPGAAPSERIAHAAPTTRDAGLRRQFQRAVAAYVFTTKVIDPETRRLLEEFRVLEAIARTRKLAAAGSTDALILLSEMGELCAWRNWDGAKRTRGQDDTNRETVVAEASYAPAVLRENIEIALDVERQSLDAWLDACADVSLDRAEIEQQLRAKADSGDLASRRRLADLSGTKDEDRLKLLRSAALGGDKDAIVAFAAMVWWQVTHDKNQAHLKEMQQWVRMAAKVSPYGQYMLGDCLLKGCDGRPPDVEGGLELLREAARQGDGFALKQLADVIAGGTGSFTSVEQYGWLVFESRLLDTGCVIPMSYAYARLDNWKRLQSMGQSLSPYELSTAQALGEQYWRDHRTRALAACDFSPS